jgi:hypothetical protein
MCNSVVVLQLKFATASVGIFWTNFKANAVRPHNKTQARNIILFTRNLSTIIPIIGFTKKDSIDKYVKTEPTTIGE